MRRDWSSRSPGRRRRRHRVRSVCRLLTSRRRPTGCSNWRRTSMSTETVLKVAGLTINVVRKDIKNLHLGVYPPAGRVRVAAPLVISDDAVRLAVIDKLAWIKLQRSKFEQQPRQSQREMAVGESHYVFGRRCRLRVHEVEGAPRVVVR